ncbi:hypothetical protein LCI18_010312 [Fusarium solani-melongenae]|uniref:Uncharacterized protein n=1 Tax=Fusarium solani subsp. cucurbitae TaxID=2747967 RepID=A0ACD3ZDT4_FUSSC|nr:hypothetical protein LCI18_010312 [Fusarium solani-melongenae]
METAASIIAFVQITGDIVKLIIKVNQLWSEAADLPHDLQDLLEELKDYSILFEELKEQLEADNATNTARSDSCVARSFVNSQQAHKILKELLDEMSTQVQSKKEGFQRTFTALKLATKKEKLERFQKRLKRSIRFLNASIMTYQLAVSRRNADTIVSRVTSNFSEQLDTFQLKHVSTIGTISDRSQKTDQTEEGKKQLTAIPRKRASCNRTCIPSQTGRLSLAYTKGTGAWQAYLQFPSWISQSIYVFQSRPTMAGWSFNYRVYNIVSSESEIITRIQNGDRNGVLELFSTRKASPFDKDANGDSLLHYAAQSKSYEICQLLLNLGLEETLYEVVGRDRESPLKPLVYQPNRECMEQDWEKIANLFQTYLQDPEDLPIVRLFDFLHEWTYSDDFIFIFRSRFMPKYYTWPLRNRLEAVRLGSFHVKSFASLPRLLSEDSVVAKADVSLSTDENLSLVHSAAVSLGIRFADEALPYRRAEFQWRDYNDAWDNFVVNVASAAEARDLHSIESVVPWDVYHVPQWRGTPLISVLGGALCYLSPQISFSHWNDVFQKTIHQWLEDLQVAGVDLLEYGKRERDLLRSELRGALDADAITASRTLTRESMARAAYGGKVQQAIREGCTENHWVPIRMIDLKIGKSVQEWELLWAPEFEHMACEFWRSFDEDGRMPGAWVD